MLTDVGRVAQSV